jgi:protoheme IX farnesyltransferase
MKCEERALIPPALDFPSGSLQSGVLKSNGFANLHSSLLLRLQTMTELTKLKLVMASVLSTTTGYLLCSRHVNAGVVTSALGVLLLALGSCALNQFQDRNYDARMNRTCRRPIPGGRITVRSAFCIAAVLILSGFVLLWRMHGLMTALIGMSAVLLYNGFYTYLKRVWAFASVPGAVIGALPLYIGWTAAGGSFADPRILALAFLFFIWQVPHFWMLLFIYGNEYERAGLPSLTQLFSPRQLGVITFFWTLAAAASSLLLPVYWVTSSLWVCFALAVCSVWLIWKATVLLRKDCTAHLMRQAFRSINIYALCVMTSLIADSLK